MWSFTRALWGLPTQKPPRRAPLHVETEHYLLELPGSWAPMEFDDVETRAFHSMAEAAELLVWSQPVSCSADETDWFAGALLSSALEIERVVASEAGYTIIVGEPIFTPRSWGHEVTFEREDEHGNGGAFLGLATSFLVVKLTLLCAERGAGEAGGLLQDLRRGLQLRAPSDR